MGNNLIKGSFQLDSTKLIRGGTAFSYAPFELKLQLHGQVSNPYTFTIKEDYKSSAITKINTHPYTEKSWTTPGTYTWTVPTAVTRIRVAVCGGGGGATYSSSHQADGSVGGTSSIKLGSDILIQATGGGGAHLDGEADGIISSKCRVGAAGSPNGVAGSTNAANSNVTRGFALSFTITNGSYGKGGGESSKYAFTTYGGGSDGYDSKTVNVSQKNSLTIVVGAAGTNHGLWNADPDIPPTSGFVLIAYGQGIE